MDDALDAGGLDGIRPKAPANDKSTVRRDVTGTLKELALLELARSPQRLDEVRLFGAEVQATGNSLKERFEHRKADDQYRRRRWMWAE